MAENKTFTQMYEDLPKIAKVLIQLLLGWIVGGIYRILRYTETKNITTLVAGIIGVIPPIGFIFEVIDIITEITSNRITVLAD